MVLTGPMAEGAMDRRSSPRPSSAMASSGRPAISPQTEIGRPAAAQCRATAERAQQHGRRQRIVAVGQARIAAVAGEQELGQVVAADRDEIGLPQQGRAAARAARAPPAWRRARSCAGTASARAARARHSRSTMAARRANSSVVAIIGNMIASGRPAAARDQGAQLLAQQVRQIEPDAQRPPADGRILLARARPIGQHLVAADIEGAEDHRPARPPAHRCGDRIPSAARHRESCRAP